MSICPTHTEGEGLKILSPYPNHGGFRGCYKCGTTDPDFLVLNKVHFWNEEEGWIKGLLCSPCGEQCAQRGPQRGDYAYSREMAKRLSR